MSHLADTHVTLMYTHLRCRIQLMPMSHSCAPISDVAFNSRPCHTHVQPTQMSHLADTHVTLTRTYFRCRIKLTPISNSRATNSDVALSAWPCHTHVQPTQMSHFPRYLIVKKVGQTPNSETKVPALILQRDGRRASADGSDDGPPGEPSSAGLLTPCRRR